MYPHLGLDDLDRILIAKCRKTAVLRWEGHPWKDLDDLELLQSAQLYKLVFEMLFSVRSLQIFLFIENTQMLFQLSSLLSTEKFVQRIAIVLTVLVL